TTLNDLIHLGYDVILQDMDVVWIKDPIVNFIMDIKSQNMDIQMSVDGRNDIRGPGNSGFVVIRSNCKTKIFVNTMINLLYIILVSRSDQILWNALLQEKVFRQLNFNTLSTDQF